MYKILKVFCLGILLTLQLKIIANPNLKGEVNLTSPLYMLQKKDSIFKLRYIQAKKYFDEENYSKSLEEGLILLNEVEKLGDIELEYLCNFLIGDTFRKINNHKKALNYLKKALEIIKSNSKFSEGSVVFYDSFFQKKQVLAKILLRIGSEFYKLRKKDSAYYYYNKVISINSLNDVVLTTKASAHSNLSGIYLVDGDFELAKLNSLKAVEIYKTKKDVANEAAALGNLASIHLEQKNYKKAKEIYLKALSLIENHNTSSALKYKEDLLFNIAYALYELKDYTAYDYQERSYLIKDSIRDVEIQHIIDRVFQKHQENLEKQKVNLEKNKVELKKLNDRKTGIFFSVLSLLVLLISAGIIYNFKLRQKNLKLQMNQDKLSQQSNLEKLKSDSQIRILNATLDGKESERKQIAETLHDSVSALLSSASLHLQASKTQFNGDTPIEINKSQKIIAEASEKIRDLSHTLVSSVLLKFGLKYAIKDMAEKYSNSQIAIDAEIKNIRRYEQNFEIKINNIIQELVNNILKHSHASVASVFLEEKEKKIFITIKDDGDGFDKKNITKKDGLGINQIQARIHMMKGSFVINSEKEKGTSIRVILPVLEKETTIRA